MNYTFFFHLTSPFSNFHPSKFEYKGITFISNEQFMMYSKAKNFHDEISAQKIIDINNEALAKDFIEGRVTREEIIGNKELSSQWQTLMMKAKKLGRGVQNYDEDFWNHRREKIVLFGAREKFKQNADLKEILINTGDSLMIEAAPRDLIWGIGLSESEAKNTHPEQWPGMNLLGKILDKLKSEFMLSLQNNSEVQQESFKPIEVLNFYKIGKTIPEDGVYIGRYNKNFNLQGSKFANPFPMKDNSLEERNRVVEAYQDWLFQSISDEKIKKSDLLLLQGKKLICYCSPLHCHGHILKNVVEMLIKNEKEFDDFFFPRSNKKLKNS